MSRKKTVIGKVFRKRLNRRLGGPGTKWDKHPKPLEVGEQVKVVKAMYGQNYKDNNIWYLLDNDEYVWSGCVQTSEEVPVTPRQVIFTCDDYGVVEEINRGIIKAAEGGFINSIAALPNYPGHGNHPGSQENIKALLDVRCNSCGQKLVVDRTVEHGPDVGCTCHENPAPNEHIRPRKLDVGVHLTITSGRPMTDDAKRIFCDRRNSGRGDKFCYFQQLPHISGDYAAGVMKNEFKRQIQVVKDAGIVPTHLSSHHNSTYFYDSYYKAFLELAEETGIPIRSPVLRPELQRNLYLKKIQGKQIKEERLLELYKPYKKDRTILSPDLLDSTHFGRVLPIEPLMRMNKLTLNRTQRLNELLESLLVSKDDVWEVVFHLYYGNRFKHGKYKDEMAEYDYEGIDHNSFDNRTIEYQSVTTGMFKSMMDGKKLDWGTWDTL